jgi:hypothetical protein
MAPSKAALRCTGPKRLVGSSAPCDTAVYSTPSLTSASAPTTSTIPTTTVVSKTLRLPPVTYGPMPLPRAAWLAAARHPSAVFSTRPLGMHCGRPAPALTTTLSSPLLLLVHCLLAALRLSSAATSGALCGPFGNTHGSPSPGLLMTAMLRHIGTCDAASAVGDGVRLSSLPLLLMSGARSPFPPRLTSWGGSPRGLALRSLSTGEPV